MSTSTSGAELAPWEEAPVIESLSEFSDFTEPDPEDAPIPPEKEPLIDEIASEFVGFWNLLVSQTNWEKGKVIHSWREKLQAAGLPKRVYSDDALSQRIGNVSPQHVGRLRRVYERFGDREVLPNLFWSHYQAALDWDDADEWLEKASNEKLSVAQTRIARWEKYGPTLQTKPRDEDIVDAEQDEDVNPFNDSNSEEIVSGQSLKETKEDAEKETKKQKKSKKKEDELGEFGGEEEPWEAEAKAGVTFTTADVLDAIGKLEALPEDLNEAMESLKISILTHKLEKWETVTPILVAQYLSELKRLLVSEEP